MTDSGMNQFASSAEVQRSFSKWLKAAVIFYLLMIPLSLYQRDGGMLCFVTASLLTMLGRKEQQMSRSVKVIWAIATFGLIIAGYILIFGRLFSRGR